MTMSILGNHLAGGSPFLKWEIPGTTYTGVITSVELRQSRKFQSTDLDFWDDGSPKMQCLLGLATDYRDAAFDDDDGTRMLSINLWSGQKKALVAACKAAGVPEPQVGQKITVTHVSGIGTAASPREFTYVLADGPAGVAQALAEPAAVQPVAAAPAPAAANPVEIAKQLLQAGATPADAAAASGLPETGVAALANTLAA
jgi:hypothetical protein